MRTPDRAFAICGDWHGNDFWAVSCVDKLREWADVDTILQVGDFGFDFDEPFRLNLEKACVENDVMIYFVDGNHDNHSWIWNKPIDEDGLHTITDHVRYIPRGHRWEWWGKTFIGIGGAVSVDRYYRKKNVSWWPTEVLTQEDYEKCIEGGHADIWISHDCPAGVNVPGIVPGARDGFWPNDLLDEAEAHRDFMYQIYEQVTPDMIFHGHYHTGYEQRFKDTKVIGLDMDTSSVQAHCRVIKSVNDLTPDWVQAKMDLDTVLE